MKSFLQAAMSDQVHPSIVAFSIKFATISCKKSPRLLNDLLTTQPDTLELLLKISRRSPLVEIVFIALMRQLIGNNLGLEWFTQKSAWNLSYEDLSYTIFTLKEAANFLFYFLQRIGENENLCVQIVEEIIRPLRDTIWMTPQRVIDVDNVQAKAVVMKLLKFLEMIFVKVMEEPEMSRIPKYMTNVEVRKSVKILFNLFQFFCFFLDSTTSLETS